MNRRKFMQWIGGGSASLALACITGRTEPREKRPNILWLVVEDMSPHMGCYGETTIRTPNIDRLAREGARFTRCFVTCPVCSPSRSALITGMYQTTIGAHHHRSSRGKFVIRLPEQVKLLPEFFQRAGYYVCNGAGRGDAQGFTVMRHKGKTDYNFQWEETLYDGRDWSGRQAGQPFFSQIQLLGGKNRRARVPQPVDPDNVKLPPYYPDRPVLRQDWAEYLNSVINLDYEVGHILKRLEDEGIAEDTIVILVTDHGISHVRDKQFLYEGGIHVPLLIRWPRRIKPGTVREDLISHIDIAATSLHMANIEVPDYMEGRVLFGPSYQPREYIISARDRCDETEDRIRCVRTKRYKYIRNFYPYRPHVQRNLYKDHKLITKTMRELFYDGKLNEVQARVFQPTRPVEELYDLQKDPWELSNLAALPAHQRALKNLRGILEDWIQRTDDKGQYPESLAAYHDNCAVLDERSVRDEQKKDLMEWNRKK